MKCIRFIAQLVLLAALGCNPDSVSQAIDDSILTQQMCKMPCWRGLTPDQSTVDDLRTLLETDTFIPKDILDRQYNAQEDLNVLVWRTNASYYYQNRIHIYRQQIISITVAPNIKFTLGDVVKRYGIPAAMGLTIDYRTQPGELHLEWTALYPQKGLKIIFTSWEKSEPKARKFPLRLDMSGITFQITSPSDDLRTYISRSYSNSEGDLDQAMNLLITNWNGQPGEIVWLERNLNPFVFSPIKPQQ